MLQSRPNLVAQQEIDDAQSRDRVGEAQIAAAKTALAAAEEQVSVSKANMERIQALLDYSKITAPFAGVITKRYADTGAMDLAQQRYDLGLSSIVELSQAQLSKTAAQIESARAKYDYQTQTAVLHYQVGILR